MMWLGLGLAGCLGPKVTGPAPFTCPDGLCPSGYHCVQELCVANGAPDPPLRLAITGLGEAPPQPVWNGERFAVFWQQNDALADSPGLHLTVLSQPPETYSMTDLTGDVAFTGLYHPPSGRYVAAVRSNSDSLPAALRVFSLRPRAGGPRTDLECNGTLTPFGFSVPALVREVDEQLGRDDVILSFTYGGYGAGQSLSNDLYWMRLDPASADRPSCATATAIDTDGRYANEVVLARTLRGLLLFWRDVGVHVTPVINDQPGVTSALPFLHVASAAVAGGKIAVAAQRPADGRLPPLWVIALDDFFTPRTAPQVVLSARDLVPDVVTNGRHFVACGRGDDGELVLGIYSVTDLQQVALLPVPRLSIAEIASCRLAVAPGGAQVAVAWAERVPPATLYQYVTLVDLPR
ncbi:MAG TPA: hypothetical protein VH877_02005 [Polyangia bacterium]|nr:hypothetical protein [Polyangia bacterium]